MDLKTLILTMPGNATATDSARLTWLKALVTVQNDATNGDVLGWCAATDAIYIFKGHSAGTDPVKRGIADAFLMRIASGGGLQLTKQDVKDLLASAVAQGMFGPPPATQNAVDALNATAQVQVERWTTQPLMIGDRTLGHMSLGYIQEARK